MNNVLRCGERPDPARHQDAGPGHGGHQHCERHPLGRSQVRMSLYIYYTSYNVSTSNPLELASHRALGGAGDGQQQQQQHPFLPVRKDKR